MENKNKLTHKWWFWMIIGSPVFLMVIIVFINSFANNKVNIDTLSLKNKIIETVKPKIQPTVTPETSLYKPSDLNVMHIVEYDTLSGNCIVEMTVLKIIRGQQALNMIKDANSANNPPKDGYEYVLAKINIKLDYISTGGYLDFFSANGINVISEQGVEYSHNGYVDCPNPNLDVKLYKGASNEGWAAFLVKKDDPYPRLALGRDYNGNGGIWFKAY